MAQRRQEPEPEVERRVRASGGASPQVFALMLVVLFVAAAGAAYVFFGAKAQNRAAERADAPVVEEVDPFAGLPPEEPPPRRGE